MARVERGGVTELVRLIPSGGGAVFIERRIGGEARMRSAPSLDRVPAILLAWIEEGE